MTSIRKAAVAGMFYPDAPDVLKHDVQGYLNAPNVTATSVPKAIIAPHAGYRYSGATAGKIYARLKPARDIITRVILMGPCHRVAVRGLALSGADGFEGARGSRAAPAAAAMAPHTRCSASLSQVRRVCWGGLGGG